MGNKQALYFKRCPSESQLHKDQPREQCKQYLSLAALPTRLNGLDPEKQNRLCAEVAIELGEKRGSWGKNSLEGNDDSGCQK